MDSVTTHIAMMRMADIQIAFWGHPYTSGYPTIDYFITSDTFESVNENHKNFTRQKSFYEQLIRFNSLSFSMFHQSNDNDDSFLSNYINDDDNNNNNNNNNNIENNDNSDRIRYLDWIFTIGFDINSNKYDKNKLFANVYPSDNHTGDEPTDNDMLNDITVYGCHQSLMKMHPLFDVAIIKILLGKKC
jgi:predicted O-linked N-acetylglucosamine transferase (SPINDLY family)